MYSASTLLCLLTCDIHGHKIHSSDLAREVLRVLEQPFYKQVLYSRYENLLSMPFYLCRYYTLIKVIVHENCMGGT